MTAKGKELGIQFDFGVDVGNTFDSHRVVYWAGQVNPEAQDRLSAALARDHFELRKCVCDWDVLCGAAERCGLGADACRRVLESGQYADDVRAELERAAEEGFHSIPQFIFHRPDGRPIVVSGAASVPEYERVLASLKRSAAQP
eukprot:TRINITY_DN11994_c0_g1_i1.p2 TRINITY_DN11994_c0_g1~~TRINITY_DN11994_c0_g1_i1.p2  ORF type:complete len:144 (+),score=46.67 TRINITY_DN11994_c0_g1_i1:310-741(+)